MLKLKNISKFYPGGSTGKNIVLDNINLSIEKSETLSIVGPSGVGKSTLLNIIGGLDTCDSGEVLLDDKNLAGMDDNELSTLRNREIGFVFQLHYLLPQFTIIENVLLPTLALQKKPDRRLLQERAIKLLEKTGLIDHKLKYPSQMSVGECQRAAVVRSLINSPKLLLADEPTGSLDEQTAAGLTELLLQINKEEQVALIIATHALELASKMDRKLLLKQGKLHESV